MSSVTSRKFYGPLISLRNEEEFLPLLSTMMDKDIYTILGEAIEVINTPLVSWLLKKINYDYAVISRLSLDSLRNLLDMDVLSPGNYKNYFMLFVRHRQPLKAALVLSKTDPKSYPADDINRLEWDIKTIARTMSRDESIARVKIKAAILEATNTRFYRREPITVPELINYLEKIGDKNTANDIRLLAFKMIRSAR